MADNRQNFIQKTVEGIRKGSVQLCFAEGFSLLELQIALVILTMGLLGLIAMMRTNSRQMEKAEAWCGNEVAYHVVTGANTWMRRFGAPAELHSVVGEFGWTPPVSGKTAYELRLDAFSRDLDAVTASATVKQFKVKDK